MIAGRRSDEPGLAAAMTPDAEPERRVDRGSDRAEALHSPAPPNGTNAPRARLQTDAASRSLNGTWRFRLHPGIRQAPDDGWQAGRRLDGFGELPVPSSWVMHGHGSPAYTNIQYPFAVEPPHAPDANPIGDHVLEFDVGPEFLPSAVLRFDGIDSAAMVWLNGIRLGTTRGSRLSHEFDASHALTQGRNVLAVRVAQFSAASYLEDQDMWWLPGIFRDVTLLARPVDGIDDVFVHADFDHRTSVGVLRIEATRDGESIEAEISVPELGLVTVSGTEHRIPEVHGWSAESPRLYEATVSTPSETVTVQLGFRTVVVEDGRFLVNGRGILLRGVNRHEHHPELGRIVPRDRLEAELRLMKQHNINAVRTSHYPPHPDFLDLADRLGFYVVLECDLETHGFEHQAWQRNPADEPAWHDALVDRMRRTVERDKNHPSVIMWSLGNESGTGENLAAMSRWAKQRDPSRPIHYEGDQTCAYVDVYSRMYADHHETELIGRCQEEPLADAELDAQRRRMPFVLCEYGHAMGNGPGGLSEYQSLFETYPRLMGGFVWEWIEHGISATDASGANHFRYGGDFGEEIHDGNFVADGLVDANLGPRPGLIDFKKVIEPIRITVNAGCADVRNAFDFADTSNVVFEYTVAADGVVEAHGVLTVPSLAPGEEVRVQLPDDASRGSSRPAIVTVSARLATATPWAEAGHEIAWGQFVATPPTPPRPRATAVVVTDAAVARLGPAAFDRTTGSLIDLDGLRISSFRANFWRAPIDNDFGVADFIVGGVPVERQWTDTGLDRLHPRLIEMVAVPDSDGGEVLTVRMRYAAADQANGISVDFVWSSDGETLALETKVRPEGGWEVPWARIGLELVIDGEAQTVAWRGRGPGQAYPDTGQGAKFGWYEAAPVDLHVDYVRPQESGARADVTRLALGFEGAQLAIEGDPFAMTVRSFSQATLAAASHESDLTADGRTHLSLDARQHGVGTAACGPGVLDAYVLSPRESSFTHVFRVRAR